jgi:hypothetical protein
MKGAREDPRTAAVRTFRLLTSETMGTENTAGVGNPFDPGRGTGSHVPIS